MTVGQPDANESGEESQPEATPTLARDEGVSGLLGELATRLEKVEEHLAESHRRAAHRESVIDRLHEENQRLHGGIRRMILEPVVTDLIRLYDQLEREGRPGGRPGTGNCCGPSLTTSRRSWTDAGSRCSRPSPAILSSAAGTVRSAWSLAMTSHGTKLW